MLMKEKLSFEKNWREMFACFFLAAAVFLYLFFLLPYNCSGLGCLFLFGIIGVLLFFSFIFLVLAFIKRHFVRQNIMLSLAWLVFLLILLSNQISLNSSLARGWHTFNIIDRCLDAGGTWNDKGGFCVMSPERVIQNHIFNMTLPVPETDNLTVTFNNIESGNTFDFAYGEFIDENSVERGRVAGYYRQIKKISNKLFIMPFSVNYGGSGDFRYLGLFNWKVGADKKKIEFLDCHFLGDRILIKDIDYMRNDNGEINLIVDYFDYANEQNFSEMPKNSRSILLHVQQDPFADSQQLTDEERKKFHDQIIKSPDGLCERLEAHILLWNSTGYEVILPYKSCAANKIFFSIKNGNELFLHDKDGTVKIMELTKLAAASIGTIEETIKDYVAYETALPRGCKVVKCGLPGCWILTSGTEDEMNSNPYFQPEKKVVKRYFTILNGFVLAFVNVPDDKLVDFESVEVCAVE